MRLLPIITLLVVLLWPFTAVAQRNCYPAADLEYYLRYKHQEIQTTVAVTNTFPPTLIETWVSPGGATWTLVELTHHGIRCVLRAGENWRPVTTMERGQPL